MTIFSKIFSGEIPCYKIAEDDQFLAFLDIMPLQHGHTLVIPKKEVDYFFDMDDDDLASMVKFAKPVAKAIAGAFPCKKVGCCVIGLEVAHAHIHLVPINSVADMQFGANKNLKLDQSELREDQVRILNYLNNQNG